MFKIRNIASGDIFSYYAQNNSEYPIRILKQEIDTAAVIKPRYRFHILNSDETVAYDIPEEDIVVGGNYTENYQNGQRRNISFTLFNYNKKYTPNINGLWAGTKISFEMGLEINDTIVWFPKGVYVINNIFSTNGQGDTNVNIEAADKFSLLEGSAGVLETSYTIPVGSNIKKVIGDLLKTHTGDGSCLDGKSIFYHSAFKDKITQATISKEVGDTIGSMILEIATQLSAEVFYDVEGHLNIIPINTVTEDVDKPIIYHFDNELGGVENLNLSFDLNSVINRIVVIGSTVNGEVCQAIAVNTNPASPLCYQRIGYRTGSPINDTNITSQILAKERAEYELRQKLILKSSTSTNVRYNPLLLVNNLVTITNEFYHLNQERFLIQSVSCPIDYSGTMSLTISNMNNFSFVSGGVANV